MSVTPVLISAIEIEREDLLVVDIEVVKAVKINHFGVKEGGQGNNSQINFS